MSLRDFLKHCLLEYCIITTCVTAAIATLGLTLDPAASFGYEAFFSPLIFGLISVIPSFVTYSRKELPLRDALIRKVLHFIVLEAMLVAFGFWAGLLHGIVDAPLFALQVLIVYLVVNLISWWLHRKAAGEINELLKSWQANNEQQ